MYIYIYIYILLFAFWVVWPALHVSHCSSQKYMKAN